MVSSMQMKVAKDASASVRNRWEILIPLFIAVVAFLLRYSFRAAYAYPMMIHEQDAIGYMDIAKSFLHLQVPAVTGRPPGYPLVIALFALLPVDLERAARLASIFMDASAVVPLYYLARHYLTRVAAGAASLLWAFFSYSLYFSTSPLSQSSYLCFLLCGVALLHRGIQSWNWKWFLSAGAAMALSFLARPEGIAGFGYCLCLSATLVAGRSDRTRQKLWLPACFLLGFLVLAGPFLVAMRVELGGWTVSALSGVQMRGVDATLTLNAQGEVQRAASTGMEFFKALPLFLASMVNNGIAFFKVYLSTFPAWVNLVTAGGGVLIIRKAPWRDTCLLLVLVVVVAPALVANLPKSHSYIYPVFAMGFICFGAFLDTLHSFGIRVARRSLSGANPRIVEASLSILLSLPIAYICFISYQGADAAYQEPGLVAQKMETEKILAGASQIIKIHSDPKDLIMTRWGLVGYFADRPVLLLPKGGVQEVLDYGRKNKAELILIDTNAVLSRRQELLELLDPLEGKEINPRYGIKVIAKEFIPDLGGYVIYRYNKL